MRKLIAESGLDASQLTGTGPCGMLLRGDVLSAMKSGLFAKRKSTLAAASKMSAPAKCHQLLAQHQVMKILPPARFRRYGIDESVVEIPVNRAFSRIQSLYMFANGEVFAINL